MGETIGCAPELGPSEVFVDKQTYDRELPGRITSEDLAIDMVYTGRNVTGSKLDPYFATDLPVRITALTMLNETDHHVTFEPAVSEKDLKSYVPIGLILRDGMLLHLKRDADAGVHLLLCGYLLNSDKTWDNAFRRMSAAKDISATALAGASR